MITLRDTTARQPFVALIAAVGLVLLALAPRTAQAEPETTPEDALAPVEAPVEAPVPLADIGEAEGSAQQAAGASFDEVATSAADARLASLIFGDTGFAAPAATTLIDPPLAFEQTDPPSTSRMAGTLFLGAALVAMVGWIVQRRKGNVVTGAIRHIQSYKLGARQQVSLVQVDGRRLLLGVTADGVVLLGDMSAAGAPVATVPAAVPVSLPIATRASAPSPEPHKLRPVVTVSATPAEASAAPAQATATDAEDDVARRWFDDGDAGRIEAVELEPHPHAFSLSGLAEDSEPLAQSAAETTWSAAFSDAMRSATGTPEHEALETMPTSLDAGGRKAEHDHEYPPPRRFARVSPLAKQAALDSYAPAVPAVRTTQPLRQLPRASNDGERSRERDGVLARLETLRSRGATR